MTTGAVIDKRIPDKLVVCSDMISLQCMNVKGAFFFLE